MLKSALKELLGNAKQNISVLIALGIIVIMGGGYMFMYIAKPLDKITHNDLPHHELSLDYQRQINLVNKDYSFNGLSKEEAKVKLDAIEEQYKNWLIKLGRERVYDGFWE
jgi:hypothetical protein